MSTSSLRCASALILFAILILAFGASTAVRADGLAGPDVEWMEDLDAAKQKARADGKLIGVFVWRPGNRSDKRYCSGTLEHKDLAEKWAEHFVLVRLDEDSPAGKAFLRRHSGRKMPVMWFFTSDYRPLKQIVGVVRRSIMDDQIDEVVGRFRGNDAPSTGAQAPEGEQDATENEPVVKHEYAATSPYVCPTTDSAIEKGLTWLADQQARSGCFARPRVHEDRRRHSSLDFTKTALTAVAGLAFQAAGSTASDGKHAGVVRKCMSWLLSHQRDDGIISDEDDDEVVHQTYSYWQHSLALLFLCEILADDGENDRVKRAIEKGCAALKTEQTRDGGWGYGLGFQERDPNGEWGWTALGPTALCVAAIAHANNLGCSVPTDVMDKGLGYINACQNRDGGVRYRLHAPYASYPQATAFATLALGLAGKSDTATAYRMSAFLRTTVPHFGRAGLGKYRYSGRIAMALAMARQGWTARYEGVGTGAVDWHIAFRDVALTGQQDDGSWKDVEGKGGREYTTACNLLALLVQKAGANLAMCAPDARPAAPTVRRVTYEDRPDPKCRWKIFPCRDTRLPALRYGVDLRIGVEQSATVPAEFGAKVLEGFQHVADLLYDCSDGRVYVRKVTFDPRDRDADECDIRFTTRRFQGVDGMAHTVRVIRNGRDAGAFGEWIECPYQLGMQARYPLAEGGGWNTPYGRRVLAHELSHYLYTLPDRYNQATGQSRALNSLMGGSATQASEYTRSGYHPDQIHNTPDWSIMQERFRDLRAEQHPDLGPYRAPAVEIDVVE